MTRARVTAQQLTRPPKAARMLRGTVSAVSPLTVQIAGGAAVRGLPIPGATYTVGGAVLVLVQEPGVGPVYPLPGSAGLDALAGYLPTSAFASIPLITALDTAPDGFAVTLGPNSPLAVTTFVETLTATISGTTWRYQRIAAENGGPIYSRRQWAGTWAAWSDGSTSSSVANQGTRADWGSGLNLVTRYGPLISLRYEVNVGATPPVGGTVLGIIPTGFRPSGSLFLNSAIVWNGWNNQRAEIQIEPNGQIILQSSTTTINANNGLFLNATYSAA